MGCTTCKCGVGLSNTGTACTPIMQVAKKVILVPYFNDDGEINSIDLTGGPFNAAYFSALVNHADNSQRWFPLPELKNVIDERAENRTETFEDGSSVFISEGDRSFTGILVKGTPKLKGKIEAARCVEVGVYIVDKNGNLIGVHDEDNDLLLPIKLDEASVSARLMKTTDTTIQKLELKFNFHSDEKDELLAMIACDELDYNVLLLKGLLDIHAVYSDISTTGFTVKLNTEYGTPLSPVVDEGLVAGDFALYNDTDSANVVVATATESAPGTYDITFLAQSSADVLFLTPSKDGRDYTDVAETPITIP
jgi:hypothetical protein